MHIAVHKVAPLKGVELVSKACPACGCSDARQFLQTRDWFFMRPTLFHLMRCPGCHLCWLQNAPAPEEMASHYGADYDKVITAPGDLYPHHWDSVRNKLLRYVQGGSILDIGCSSGSFLRTLKGGPWKLYGIEMSKIVADHARATTGAEIFVGDVLDAPFPENTFDAVTGFHVLEHMGDPREVMNKVRRWLKPGAVFYIGVPNVDSWEARIFGRYWYGLEVPRHLWQFSIEALRSMAESVGFEAIETGTTPSCYVELSIRNIVADLESHVGIEPTPLCQAHEPSIAFRIVRKAFRLAVLYGFKRLASVAGRGGDIQVVLRRPDKGETQCVIPVPEM
jgi:SAM-dependent methyltransferase